MIERDYFMKQIHDMVCAIGKIIFNVDLPRSNESDDDFIQNEEDKNACRELCDMADKGNINKAVSKLNKRIDSSSTMDDIKIMLKFYDYLSTLDEQFLEEHEFNRRRIKTGIVSSLEKYGYQEDFINMFML